MNVDASRWTESDPNQLISNSIQENVQLDYKACAALQSTEGKKTEISKDISALANAAGGVIVYGIIEEGHVPVRLDDGFDPNVVTKEWLEQVISSRIQRRIDGLRINSVDLATSNPGRVAYVVVVPQSKRAPHQASDKRFYKRFNFESVPMEEYEIRYVARRSEGPLLKIELVLEDVTLVVKQNGTTEAKIRRVKLMPLISNESPTPAEYISINLYIDSTIRDVAVPGDLQEQKGNTMMEANGRAISCRRWNMNHAIPGKIPIFSGSTFRLLTGSIHLDVEHNGDYFIGYSLVAPYMDQVTSGATVRVHDGGASLSGL